MAPRQKPQHIVIDSVSKYKVARILSGLCLSDSDKMDAHEKIKELLDLETLFIVGNNDSTDLPDIKEAEKTPKVILDKPLKLKITTNNKAKLKETLDKLENLFYVLDSKFKSKYHFEGTLVEDTYDDMFPSDAKKREELANINKEALGDNISNKTTIAFNEAKKRNPKANEVKSSVTLKKSPLNEVQEQQRIAIIEKDVVLVEGPSGTGKTLMACLTGLELVHDQNSPIEKIYITRGIAPLGKDIGYLPGSEDQKMAPWTRPLFKNIEKLMPEGSKDVKKLINDGVIEVVPISSIRGNTYEDGVFVIDEPQNLNFNELKAILERAGENLKFVLTGSFEQSDVRNSGYEQVVDMIKNAKNPELQEKAEVIQYSRKHVVRSELSRLLQEALNDDEYTPPSNENKKNGPNLN